MTSCRLDVVVPGPLDQRTGGYIYDAHIVAGLRTRGWRVVVHNLDGTFPEADASARDSLSRTLAGIGDGARVIIDGLGMGSLPGPVRSHETRLRMLALVHHLLADETGLTADRRARLASLERDALGACAGVLVTSAFTASRLAALGVPPTKVRAVRPGTARAAPALGPGPDAPPQLLCTGSVIPRKGHDVLVRALARLGDRRWHCVCAGSLARAPDYAREVQLMVGRAGLTDRIDFTGECAPDDLSDLYHTSSLFVLPSHFEGYGMALAEALARGLPIVSTTGGAIPSTVPAAAGVLVPPGDDGELATALDALLGDSGAWRRATLAAAARRHAARLPSWDQATEAFAQAVLELTPQQPSPGA